MTLIAGYSRKLEAPLGSELHDAYVKMSEEALFALWQKKKMRHKVTQGNVFDVFNEDISKIYSVRNIGNALVFIFIFYIFRNVYLLS